MDRILALYITGALYFLPSVVGNGTNLGLSDGTLYDLIDANEGAGNVTVNSTGLSVSCGHLEDVANEFTFDHKNGFWSGNWTVNGRNKTLGISNTQRGIITTTGPDSGEIFQSTLFYSTIPIIDSNNIRGPVVNLNPPMNYSVSVVQIFQCIHTPIAQTAVVDAQSRQILTVEPDLDKSVSAWRPYAGPTKILTVEDIFDTFPILYGNAPLSDIPLNEVVPSDDNLISVADLYLVQRMNLLPVDDGDAGPANVTLHDLENTLAQLFASMIWTGEMRQQRKQLHKHV
ncbi:hypothetical protein GGX14DRAFT_560531 [Mycena pura]|uniref:Uncharacterized protein n=1 Tax=Mycena pura TaxID=153505 RepID=A0AAD6YGX4_9AGAR|nr:hypothetical protein GGX14DRAFT_560531 [Mycena pura]